MNSSKRHLLLVLALIFMLAGYGQAAQVRAADADKVVVWSPGDNGSVKDWNSDPILQVVEKATNTSIEMVKIGWDTYTDQLNAAIASGKVPDIIGVIDHNNRTLINQWIKDGVIAPLEGDVAKAAPNVLADYDKNPTLAELRVGGKIYGKPISWGSGNYPNMGLLHIRQDLLDKYKMQQPDTFDAYFRYLDACTKDGLKGVVFSGKDGLLPALNAFAGAYGQPILGWPKTDKGYSFWAVQPGIKDALLMFRKMVASNQVDPVSWEANGDQARTEYVTGKACAYIFNGGGHIGRIQNDMTLANKDFKELMLPALDAGKGARGYTTEPQFWGLSFVANLKGNNPVAAARVLNYLASDEGLKLTSVGIKDRDYSEDKGDIKLLDARTQDGFPTELGNTGAHPLATTIVSWQPQEWQDFALLYGKDQAFKDWYKAMWDNQGKYQIKTFGLLSSSPKWTDFQSTSTELVTRTFVQIMQAKSDDEASKLFDQFVQDWNAQGGADAAKEMNDLLSSIYK